MLHGPQHRHFKIRDEVGSGEGRAETGLSLGQRMREVGSQGDVFSMSVEVDSYVQTKEPSLHV